MAGTHVGPMPPLETDVSMGVFRFHYKSSRFRRAPCNDKVVAVAHAANGLDDFTLIVFDDLDPLQVLPAR